MSYGCHFKLYGDDGKCVKGYNYAGRGRQYVCFSPLNNSHRTVSYSSLRYKVRWSGNLITSDGAYVSKARAMSCVLEDGHITSHRKATTIEKLRQFFQIVGSVPAFKSCLSYINDAEGDVVWAVIDARIPICLLTYLTTVLRFADEYPEYVNSITELHSMGFKPEAAVVLGGLVATERDVPRLNTYGSGHQCMAASANSCRKVLRLIRVLGVESTAAELCDRPIINGTPAGKSGGYSTYNMLSINGGARRNSVRLAKLVQKSIKAGTPVAALKRYTRAEEPV